MSTADMVKNLRALGLSYRRIGLVLRISWQRCHQIETGYVQPARKSKRCWHRRLTEKEAADLQNRERRYREFLCSLESMKGGLRDFLKFGDNL